MSMSLLIIQREMQGTDDLLCYHLKWNYKNFHLLLWGLMAFECGSCSIGKQVGRRSDKGLVI